MEVNDVLSKDEQEDEESKREGMQLVRGQVATVLENYYKDTLAAPSGAPLAELVDKTSLKASQITSWYYRRKRKGSPQFAGNSLSDSENNPDGETNVSSKRETGASKRAKFPASTVSKVEKLFNQLNGVLPSQKELAVFSAELNLSGSQVYAWWYRHKARLDKNEKEQQEIQSRVISGMHSETNKHSTGVHYPAWCASGLSNQIVSTNNNSIPINGHSTQTNSIALAQAQQLAAALMHRVDKYTLQMHYTNPAQPPQPSQPHAHPSLFPGSVGLHTPIDVNTLRMLHTAATPLPPRLFNYGALDSARRTPALTAESDRMCSHQPTLKVTAGEAPQQLSRSTTTIGPQRFLGGNNSLDNLASTLRAGAATRAGQPYELPYDLRRSLQPAVFGAVANTDQSQPLRGNIPYYPTNHSPAAGAATNPLIRGTAGAAESAVGALLMNADPATQHLVTALVRASRPAAGASSVVPAPLASTKDIIKDPTRDFLRYHSRDPPLIIPGIITNTNPALTTRLLMPTTNTSTNHPPVMHDGISGANPIMSRQGSSSVNPVTSANGPVEPVNGVHSALRSALMNAPSNSSNHPPVVRDGISSANPNTSRQGSSSVNPVMSANGLVEPVNGVHPALRSALMNAPSNGISSANPNMSRRGSSSVNPNMSANGLVEPVNGVHPALRSALMNGVHAPSNGSSPLVGGMNQQWLANMLASNLTNLAAPGPAAPGTKHQVIYHHQLPLSHLPAHYPPPEEATLSAARHQQPAVVTDKVAAMSQTILVLQVALQSAQAELRRAGEGVLELGGGGKIRCRL